MIVPSPRSSPPTTSWSRPTPRGATESSRRYTDRFKDPDDHFEYIPVKLNALTGRSEKTNQESATGFYPHAGILSTFPVPDALPDHRDEPQPAPRAHVLSSTSSGSISCSSPRASMTPPPSPPSTRSRRCRLPTAWSATRSSIRSPASSKTTTHSIATGVYKRRDEGWFEDMFAPGHEGEAASRIRTLARAPVARRTHREGPALRRSPWSNTSGTSSPGARPCSPPEDIDDPLFAARQRAYPSSGRRSRRLPEHFAAASFNLKSVFKELACPRFYRADGTRHRTAENPSQREAELDDLGLVRLLSPEQLERKLEGHLRKRLGAARRTVQDPLRRHRLPRRSPNASPTRAAPWARSSA